MHHCLFQLWPLLKKTQLGHPRINSQQSWIVEAKLLNLLWTVHVMKSEAEEEANPHPQSPCPLIFFSPCSSIPGHNHQERQNIPKQYLTVLAGARKAQWYYLGLRGQVLWEGGGTLIAIHSGHSTLIAFNLGLNLSLWPFLWRLKRVFCSFNFWKTYVQRLNLLTWYTFLTGEWGVLIQIIHSSSLNT